VWSRGRSRRRPPHRRRWWAPVRASSSRTRLPRKTAENTLTTPPPPEPDVRTLAKPSVRKLARDLGVDLAAVTPTGPDGTVSQDDVTAVATQKGGWTGFLAERGETRIRRHGHPARDRTGHGRECVHRAARHRVDRCRRQPHDGAARADEDDADVPGRTDHADSPRGACGVRGAAPQSRAQLPAGTRRTRRSYGRRTSTSLCRGHAARPRRTGHP